MSQSGPLDIDRLLSDVSNPEAFAELMRLSYAELRGIAAHLFRQERLDHTLQPTALVHQLYIRLFEGGPDHYENRAQFFYIATRNMRRILTEHARRRNAKKRDGLLSRVSLDDVDLAGPEVPDYEAIDKVIAKLESTHPQLGRIAELRVFAGLSSHEIAKVLNLAEATVRKKWCLARAWLEENLQGVAR